MADVKDYAGLLSAYQGRLIGDEYYMLCLWHSDGKPSLSANVSTGLYCCRGCGAGGDLASLIAELDQSTRKAAREKIRDYGKVVRPKPRTARMASKKLENFLPLETPDYIDYLKGRGISAAAIRTMNLREGPLGDPVWRDRIIWPYRNDRGTLTCVEGRVAGDNTNRRKYHKMGGSASSAGLIGLENLTGTGPVLVVEGVFDLLSVRTLGYARSVALGDSSVSARRVKMLLRSGATSVVVVYDGCDSSAREARDRVERDAMRELAASYPANGRSVNHLEEGDPNESLLSGRLAVELKGFGLEPRFFR